VTHRDTRSTPPHPRETLLQRFGTLLRSCRKQRGLSQRALAARTGIHHTYISEIELGQRNISVLTLLRVTAVLDMPASWLLTRMDACTPLTAWDSRPPPSTQDAAVTRDDTPAPRCGAPETLLQLLGTTLRQHRQRLGLTHKVLAARTGLDNSYIGEMERGERNASILSLMRLAKALGVSVSALLAPLEKDQSSSPPPTESSPGR
jgi:transcriptional regulator with XRE-family HTH domain